MQKVTQYGGNGVSVRQLMIVAAFAAFVALAGLWALPPLDRDEARFAQATAQMIETGDYLVIRFQDRERNKKPAGIYWLQAASVSIFSDAETRKIWAYRIPSLIGVIFAAIFTYLCAQRLYDQRTAFLSALLISSAPIMAAEATIAKTDGVLLAFVGLAQFAFIKIYAQMKEGGAQGWRWPIIFWTAQSAGILIKGPVAPLVSLLTGVGLLTGKPHFAWIARMRPIAGLFILLIFIAPWATAISLATEGRFFTEAVGGDMLAKISTAQESHSGPPGYHSLLVWFLFWPASALLLPGLLTAWRNRNQWRERFLLSWVIPGFIMFELAATKLPHYVLPLYPALAIIAAQAAARNRETHDWSKKAGAVIYGVVGLVGAGLIAALPVIFSEASLTLLCFAAAALLAAATLLIAILFWRGRSYEGGVAASVLAALFAWVLMTGVLPGLSKLAITPRISTALEQQSRHPLKNGAAPVAFAGYSEPSAVFLLGTDTVLTTGEAAARKLSQGDVSTAIIERREEKYFLARIKAEGTNIRKVAVIDGLNYSNSRNVTLTIYIRETAE
jgi:4-amino-4-deoxy-L-arabinose transferase-like glycosyltransferase